MIGKEARRPLWVITAAGRGSRFRDAGYSLNKEAISLFGLPLAWWALVGIRDLVGDSDLCLVTRCDGQTDAWWENVFSGAGLPRPHIVRLDEVTAGQAETVMRAITAVDGDTPLVVWNIDTLVRPSVAIETQCRTGNWLLCFPSAQPNLSYARVNADGTITEVREKVVISPWATAGMYGFASVNVFRRAFGRAYGNSSDEGELYVAPMYTEIMAESPVLAWKVGEGDVLPLGTPSEVAKASDVEWVARLARSNGNGLIADVETVGE